MKTHMNSERWITLIICTALCLLSADHVIAQEKKETLSGHVFYGKMIIQNNDPNLGGGDFDISMFGLDVQQANGQGNFKYGLEGGGFFSLDSEVRQFSASSGSGGGSASVSVDINSFLIDVFFGGYVGYRPVKWLQFNVGGGPLVIWGKRNTDPVATPYDETTSGSESEFGAGLYARAGIDIFFTENFGVNVGARITETTLSFENVVGKVDVEGYQYYLGLAYRF